MFLWLSSIKVRKNIKFTVKKYKIYGDVIDRMILFGVE